MINGLRPIRIDQIDGGLIGGNFGQDFRMGWMNRIWFWVLVCCLVGGVWIDVVARRMCGKIFFVNVQKRATACNQWVTEGC